MLAPPRWILAPLFILLAASCVPDPARGSVRYHLTDLRADEYDRHYFSGVNEQGQLIGWTRGASPGPRAFLYDSRTGSVEDWGRDLFDGQESRTLDINGRGQALVAIGDDFQPSYAIVDRGQVTWSSSPAGRTAYTSIGADGLPRGFDQEYEQHYGMRATSVVVGERRTPTPTLPDNAEHLSISQVADSGLAVGSYYFDPYGTFQRRPFLLKDGELTDVGTPGASSASVMAVNSLGEMAISERRSQDDPGPRMIYIDRDGQRTIVEGGRYSVNPEAINESGHVVGVMITNDTGPFDGSPSAAHAFLFDGEALHDLNDLLSPEQAGWTLTWATDITDLGQILARALGPDGWEHPILLTPDHLPAPIAPTSLPEYPAPVPEPATLLVLGAGIGWMLIRRRGRAAR